jgi:hypothetical protein
MRPILSLALAACLTACVSTPRAPDLDMPKAVYGTFFGMGPELEKQLAEAAASRLSHGYPPHRYLLDFQQRIDKEDGFGLHLMSALQRNGHFLRQWHDPSMPPQCRQKPASRKDGEDFRIVTACYLVDDVAGMTRLSLFAEGKVWNRLFTVDENKLRPAGAWTQQKVEE